eukprot:g8969.t1
MSLRKLKYHEKKLLKKVDFLQWKTDDSLRETEVLRRYHVQDREDYRKYNKLVGEIHRIVTKLTALDATDPYRIKTTTQLLNKLYAMGLIPSTKSLSLCSRVSVSSFCRRRLPVVMVRLKMSQSVKQAVALVEHGHVRIGPETVTDPAFLVTRTLEDWVSWVDSSKIKQTIVKYHDKLDDFSLLDS